MIFPFVIPEALLDITDPALARAERIANCDLAITAFARTLEGRGTTVAFEAKGTYDSGLRHALASAGDACVRVNPQRARDFARATGLAAFAVRGFQDDACSLPPLIG